MQPMIAVVQGFQSMAEAAIRAYILSKWYKLRVPIVLHIKFYDSECFSDIWNFKKTLDFQFLQNMHIQFLSNECYKMSEQEFL